ncbi:hypothetical protein PFISCL1PPCAC_8919, partial [Pristionchus fissidentatus]
IYKFLHVRLDLHSLPIVVDLSSEHFRQRILLDVCQVGHEQGFCVRLEKAPQFLQMDVRSRISNHCVASKQR